MTDTSNWPQWMQIAWRRLVENEQPSPADARYALLLLAQAERALKDAWDAIDSGDWQTAIAIIDNTLSRIRAGGGDE